MAVTGLSTEEAERKLRQYGPNRASSEHRLPGVRAFLARFKNPLIIILLVAAATSAILGDGLTFVIIAAIIGVSIVLDFANTYRSEKAAKDLTDKVRVTASVWRDGRITELALAQIVPGDVVKLTPGKLVPADGDVLSCKDLYTNESSLTGESEPQAKVSKSSLYMGSSVTSGEGTMLVVKTGSSTQFAHIAASLQVETETEFDRELRGFSYLIMRVTAVLVIGIFIFNMLLRHSLLESLLFSLALAVGLTPSLLPLIMTLNLTKGSLKMAKQGVIVKKLSAIQNFGSMDILCTDKTGTLTEDKITLVKYVDGFGAESETVLLQAYLTSQFTSAYESPLDRAVKAFKKIDIKGYHKTDEIPFNFERKRESAVIEYKGQCTLMTKGAPEAIFTLCSATAEGRPWDDAAAKQVAKEYEALSQDGFRVLAIASKRVRKKVGFEEVDEQNMTFEGFVAFLDPAKKSAADALEKMRAYGVEIKIISGDNLLVNQRIATDINLNSKGTLTGDQIDALNDLELIEAAENTTLFVRVNPQQKQRIVKTLQANGHVVGYLGDGINDTPALRTADIGISVKNAVDIAKDTAALILLHKNLNELIEGVIEGRRTFANTMKYLMMSLSSNFGNMASMAGASLFLPFLPMLAPQILLNNLLYDGSQFGLPSDTTDPEMVAKPHRLSIKGVKRFMLVFGPLSSVFDFATFGVLLYVFHLSEHSFQAGWFIESIVTQIFVVYIIRTRRIPFLQSRPSRILALTTVGAVAVACFMVASDLGQQLFKFGDLPSGVAWFMAGLVVVYLFSAQIIKTWFYKKTTII
jgi:Mg2+-importing ATPase